MAKENLLTSPRDAHFSRLIYDTTGEKFLKYLLRPFLPEFSPLDDGEQAIKVEKVEFEERLIHEDHPAFLRFRE